MPTIRTILLLVLPPVAVLVAWGIATHGTSFEGGRVPIPGRETVELQPGTVALSYEEDRNLEEGSGTPIVDDADFLEIPADLAVTVRSKDGGPELELDRTSFGSVVEDDAGSRKVFAKVEVPRSGSYVIATRPLAAAPRADAFVTLGEDPLGEFAPWALAALGAFGAGGLVAVAFAWRERRRRSPARAPLGDLAARHAGRV
jgi:hypothetical protein